MLLFLDYKIYVTTDKSGKGKASGGARVIRTSHTPQWDAKNRFGLPDEMPLNADSAERIASLMRGGEALNAENAPDGQPDDKLTDRPQSELNTASQGGGEAPAAPHGKVEYPPRMSALSDLMLRDHVRDSELRAAVASKGYFPIECAAVDYPQDFVEWLVGVWPSFMRQIETLRIDVPFDGKDKE